MSYVKIYPSKVPTRMDGPNEEKANDFARPLYFPKLQNIVLDFVLMSCTPRTP